MSSSNTNSKINPAQLYQFYRRNRTHDAKLDALYKMSVEDEQEAASTSATVAESGDANSASVSRIFEAYRRESGATPAAQSVAIDAIMRQIAIDSARERLLSTHFSYTNEAAAVDATQTQEMPSQGLFKSLFELPGKLLDGAVKSVSRKRMILAPAMAMALLAVFIVPRMMSPTDPTLNTSAQIASVTALSPSLLEQAHDTEESINSNVQSMVGFTSGQSEIATRFQLGQTVAQVGLIVAGNLDTDVTALTDFLGSASADGTELNDQRLRLSDAVINGESGDVVAALSELDAAQKLNNNGLHAWYEFGQVMEAVHVSTEIALRDENLQPLNDSLQRLRQFEPVSLISNSDPLNARIAELQQLAGSDELTLIDARRIQGLAQSIRALAGQLQ